MYIFAKTSNATTQICKVWPPCTACQPGNLETPSEHLSVSRSGRTRWPEDMMRPGEPGLVWNTQHSPHTRPTVCELPARNQDGRTHGNIACKRNNKLRTAQQQASAATVQNRAAGTFSHRKQRQQRKIDKSAKCGLPSQHASQETWKPPASTLAHRLAVHTSTTTWGCVGRKGLSNQVNAATRCRSGAPSMRPTPGQRCAKRPAAEAGEPASSGLDRG